MFNKSSGFRKENIIDEYTYYGLVSHAFGVGGAGPRDYIILSYDLYSRSLTFSVLGVVCFLKLGAKLT